MSNSYMITLAPEERGNFFDVSLSRIDSDEVSKIGSFVYPYSSELFWQIQQLKLKTKDLNFHEILALPEFKGVHSMYVYQAANCVKKMCEDYQLDKEKVDAVLFYSEKLRYISNTVDKKGNAIPGVLQFGSGRMLADLTGIKVVYNIPQSQFPTREVVSSKNEISFLSILNGLFKLLGGKSKDTYGNGNTSDLIETKVAGRCTFRHEKYGYGEYEYDDMLNKEQMSAEEKEKIARCTAWMRYGSQARFGR